MWSRIWQDSYWRCGSNLEDSKMFHNKSSPIQTSIRHLFRVCFVLIIICKSTFTGITSLLAIFFYWKLYKHEPSDALIHYWRLSIFHDSVCQGFSSLPAYTLVSFSRLQFRPFVFLCFCGPPFYKVPVQSRGCPVI